MPPNAAHDSDPLHYPLTVCDIHRFKPKQSTTSITLCAFFLDSIPARCLSKRSTRHIACSRFYAVVLADAQPAALFAHASLVVELAEARFTALLAVTSLVVVLADARAAELLAPGVLLMPLYL
jgi:hypothetical protein